MKTTMIWGLLALNISLLMLFVFRTTGDKPAAAQIAGRPGDYLMIPGEVNGGNDAVVYILDQSSHTLSAMVYDDGMKRLAGMPPINLDKVFASIDNVHRPVR